MSTIHDTHSKWVMSRMSHAWVMSHTCVSHVTDSYAWHDSFEWFLLCVSLWVLSLSRGTHERESYYTYACTMPYLCIIYVSLMNKDECVISCSILFACLINRHAKKRKAWLICHVIHFMIHETHVSWVMLRMSHVTHMCESCDWFIRVTWLVWMICVVCVSMSHVTYIREACHLTDSHTWHDSSRWFRCRHESCHAWAWVTVHICASHVTPVHQPCHTHE